MSKIRVLLAEDHHVVRAAVASFLANEDDIEVVGEVAEVEGLVETVASLAPDVLLLDAHMPGHNVIETARALNERESAVRILVLSAYKRKEYVVGLLGAGAAGYVLKDDPPESLAQAVRAVASGRPWLSPRVAEVLVKSASGSDDAPLDELTEREVEVLRWMATGMRNDRIAETLSISEQTVKNHVRNIYAKLGAETRVEAVLYAIGKGWVQTENED